MTNPEQKKTKFAIDDDDNQSSTDTQVDDTTEKNSSSSLDIPDQEDVKPLQRNKTVIQKNIEAKEMVAKFSTNRKNRFAQSETGGGILTQLLRLSMLKGGGHSKSGYSTPNPRDIFKDNRTHSGSTIPLASNRSSFADDGYTAYALEEQLNITANIADLLLKQDYLMVLSKAMVMFGSPAHRLEYNMSLASNALDIETSFAFLPGVAIISFGDADTHTSDTHILKADRGYNMDKLERAYEISRQVIYGELSVEVAYELLEEMMEEKPVYSWWVQILNYCLCSFLICPLAFNGDWIDALLSGALGFCVGCLSILSSKIFNYSNVFEITAAIICSFVASALHKYANYSSVMLSGVTLLLPGLSLTTSVIELGSKNLISGVVRLVFALVSAFMLGFGLNIGTSIWKSIDGSKMVSDTHAINAWWYFLLLPLLAVNYCIFLNATFRQWPPILTLSIVGFVVSYFTSGPLGAQVSAAISAFVVAFLGNVYSRITHRFGFAAVLSGTMLLVPGSMGVKGFLALFTDEKDRTDDNSGGATLAFQMIVVALSIAVGLFVASLLVYPFGKRRTAMMMF
ncbi:pheromone-regulated protein prm10 [Basidiobolus ranarum]|uniref:Pheromone-regulated protein prm10 n=1 Tax=Basidiobolus ranarum TaxID=34480 RepID=A0ABR2VVH0_9FUNG